MEAIIMDPVRQRKYLWQISAARELRMIASRLQFAPHLKSLMDDLHAQADRIPSRYDGLWSAVTETYLLRGREELAKIEGRNGQ